MMWSFPDASHKRFFFGHAHKPRATFIQITCNNGPIFITDEGLSISRNVYNNEKSQWQNPCNLNMSTTDYSYSIFKQIQFIQGVVIRERN